MEKYLHCVTSSVFRTCKIYTGVSSLYVHCLTTKVYVVGKEIHVANCKESVGVHSAVHLIGHVYKCQMLHVLMHTLYTYMYMGTCTPPPTTPTGNVETGKKEVVFSGHRKGVEGVVGHRGHVMALAVSSDGKFMVSETDHTICVTM